MTLPEQSRLAVLAEEIRADVKAAEAHFQTAVQHAVNAGEKLIEAKSLVRHGEWLPWLEANFPGSRSTAANYMRLAANVQHVAHLPTVREAIALLAAPRPQALDLSRIKNELLEFIEVVKDQAHRLDEDSREYLRTQVADLINTLTVLGEGGGSRPEDAKP